MAFGEICDIKDCTGCFACLNICPVNCIKMVEENYGYIYPEIEDRKCIKCDLCKKVCPAEKESKSVNSMKAFAVWNLDNEDRRKSASGGAATVLSRKIVDDGGVVFGCTIDKNLEIRHDYAESKNELDKFKGSKYVQSDINTSFRQIKKYLISGRKVIFIGTPCQVDGLNFYLGNEYLNLFTVDLICHGVPPKKYLKEHIKNITSDKITNLTFRGENDFNLTLFSKDKIIYKKSRDEDLYFKGFLEGLYYREKCYSCKYSNPKRVSDITIGDFWGLGKNKPFDRRGVNRISVVLINTNKGDELFELCKEQFFYEEREIEEAILGNDNLREPSSKHKNYYLFKEVYIRKGFSKAVRIAFKKDIKEYRKKKIKTYCYGKINGLKVRLMRLIDV